MNITTKVTHKGIELNLKMNEEGEWEGRLGNSFYCFETGESTISMDAEKKAARKIGIQIIENWLNK